MLVSPSIVAASLTKFQAQVKECEDAGAYSFHLDVMDGNFVPNITVGPDFYFALRSISKIPIDTHLMVDRPDYYYEKFLSQNDRVLIHYESPINIKGLIKKMENEGVKYGLVINPNTPFSKVSDLLERAEILLIMSVYPGFSGQKFIDVSEKIKEARNYIKEMGLRTMIEVDGGINENTAKIVKNAGADIVVSASYLFSGDITDRIKTLSSI
ncbi:ribulose-5-phosphate 3-epimerase [Thermoplasma volcanium GSS1]|uniref:Ribulose-phosphate 3-epimerase n=1 Tax=Thermoplasma volcanium (strain ATCC 51530 / DSM 4299 / JCM 9571 / NBRC 15438 / GSS1) TaxID=273116 RepID=Q97C39_THEVO|nr:ribulose-phosphate 3-epimerase [Thermoplasma volcanium]BAB59408.1 ribulose-5-phosphate 3-epimerase [Thermoplasma volcanium GSS1]